MAALFRAGCPQQRAGAHFLRRMFASQSSGKKTIVCFGDSNTWGYDGETKVVRPALPNRFNENERWSGVLRKLLGDGFNVVEEGLNGRTTVFDDPLFGEYCVNGRKHLKPILHSHKPIDLVVLMLGTNDLKVHFNATPHGIAAGAGLLVDDILRTYVGGKSSHPPAVLLMSPPRLLSPMTEAGEAWSFSSESCKKSDELGPLFAKVADQAGVSFLDAAEVQAKLPLKDQQVGDGVHFGLHLHAALGNEVAHTTRSIILPARSRAVSPRERRATGF